MKTHVLKAAIYQFFNNITHVPPHNTHGKRTFSTCYNMSIIHLYLTHILSQYYPPLS